MDDRALGQREAGVVLDEDLAEETGGVGEFPRRQPLIADRQHRVLRERAIELLAGFLAGVQPKIDAAHFGSSVIGQRADRKAHGLSPGVVLVSRARPGPGRTSTSRGDTASPQAEQTVSGWKSWPHVLCR